MTKNTEIITEHILSLMLYALAEADQNKMETIVSILDDALMKLIAEHEKLHGSQHTWDKCTDLYKEILRSINDNNNIKNIPVLSDLK